MIQILLLERYEEKRTIIISHHGLRSQRISRTQGKDWFLISTLQHLETRIQPLALAPLHLFLDDVEHGDRIP